MKIFRKIILTLVVLFSVAAIPVRASAFDELNLKIKDAEKRLQNSIEVLTAINPKMCDIVLNEPWTPNYNFANYYFLNFYTKEFFEYSNAVGDLEDLKELRFYATMNYLSNQPKDSITK